MNSSDADGINEIESSTDIKINLNTENQSEAEEAIDSLYVSNESEAIEPEQRTSKGQEKASKINLSREQLGRNLQSTLEKRSRNKNSKTRKKATRI